MTIAGTLYHRFKRHRSLQTSVIKAMPLVVLMPHSGCNCRCVMCDIWKDNQQRQQLTANDISQLLVSLKKLGTQQVLMSGGEALLHPAFFQLCDILRQEQISVVLLSTGLTLKKHAQLLTEKVSEIIVSLDGDPATHDRIRNIAGAFDLLQEGVEAIRAINPAYRITARTVLHQLNFRIMGDIIRTAKKMGLNQISFLPADVSSHAFNREVLWSGDRQQEILIAKTELPDLKNILERVNEERKADNGFIAESADRLMQIHTYYSALHGLQSFPYQKCNAPWVSAVVEADGTIRPCFFHEAMGNIREGAFNDILNSKQAIRFRKNLDVASNPTCEKCVCRLYLSPGTTLSANHTP